MIQRFIQKEIEKDLFQGKAIILTGPRQVGKTTLLSSLIKDYRQPALFLNCDEPDVRAQLENASSSFLASLIGDNKLVLIDEAQRVKNIGLTLKLITDNLKDVQLIATGSAALELANEINEPLTGRKKEYHLYPLSTAEMVQYSSSLEEKRLLAHRMIYGLYPDIINKPDKASSSLVELINNYLYKDILLLEGIRKPATIEKLLIALALQIGNEVSYHELAQTINSDPKTIERYIDLLEKCFVIYQLGALSRNLRNEIKKGKKIYFYDNGIRNAIIKNFAPLNLRQDTGALWENFIVSERKKANHYNHHYVNNYFWRTHQQQEIDLIEETDGKLYAWEFKWNDKAKVRKPSRFLESYENGIFRVIDRTNYLPFLEQKK